MASTKALLRHHMSSPNLTLYRGTVTLNSAMMRAVKFSANLNMLFVPESPSHILNRLHLAKAAGFRAVETVFPLEKVNVDDLVRMQQSTGLTVAQLNAMAGEDLGHTAVDEQRFMESLEASLDVCQKVNCPKLHLMSGRSNANEEIYRKNLKNALPYLEKYNVVGLIEPIAPQALPNYFMNDFDLALDILKELNSPFLRLQLDIFHLQFLKGNVTENIDQMWPYVGHVQVAQNPHRHEPDVGGELDLKYIMDYILDEKKYDHYIGLEYKPKNGTVQGLGWIEKFGYQL